MDETSPPESDLSSAFRELGENLRRVLRTAWESDERQNLQHEVTSGLSELEKVLKETVEDLARGETGARLRAELDDLRARVRRGEVQARAQEELLAALRTVNAELEKASQRWSHPEKEAATPSDRGQDEGS